MKSRSNKGCPWILHVKNCFIYAKITQSKVNSNLTILSQLLMIFIQFLLKDSKDGRKGRGTQPLESKMSKYFQIVWPNNFTKGLWSRQWFYQNSKVSTLVQGPRSRENLPNKRFPTANQKGIFQTKLHVWNKKVLINFQSSHLKPFTCEGDIEYMGWGSTEQRGLKVRVLLWLPSFPRFDWGKVRGSMFCTVMKAYKDLPITMPRVWARMLSCKLLSTPAAFVPLHFVALITNAKKCQNFVKNLCGMESS